MLTNFSIEQYTEEKYDYELNTIIHYNIIIDSDFDLLSLIVNIDFDCVDISGYYCIVCCRILFRIHSLYY